MGTKVDFHALNIPEKCEAESRNISTHGELSYILECQAIEFFVCLNPFIMNKLGD